MVQSYQSPVRVYKHPFELIMAAYERRFPSCDLIPIMASTDIVKQEELEGGAIQVISRRCHLHAEVPYLLKKIMGVEFLYFIQTNSLNRRDRVLEIEAYNESFSSRVIINETCKYSVHPENPEWTCFEQTAKLDVKNFFGFESTVEKLAMKQYSQNISKGKEIIQHFLDILKEEGVTSVPRWQPPEGSLPSGSGAHNGAADEEESEDDDDFEDADDAASQDTVEEREIDSGVEAVKEELRNSEETIKRNKDGRESVKKDRKDSLGNSTALRRDKKKKDSVGSDGGLKDKKEEGDDKTKGAVKKTLSESLSIDDGHDKLDSDYIAACLGDLTPLQESRLVQLKKWVSKLQKSKAPCDTTLLRFLRARDFHLEKSREMLSQSLLWRKRNQVDKIISDYQPSEVLSQLTFELPATLLKPYPSLLSLQHPASVAGCHATRLAQHEGGIDGHDKLDSDYIAACLGDLTPLQESRLVQLKKWVSKLQKSKAPCDTTLLRFLRARDFHLEKSREMLSQSLLWRKRNQVDKIISDYQPSEVLSQYFPGGWHYSDKDGRPLFLLRLGQMDVKGLVKSVGEEGLLRHTLAICEEGLRLTEEATRQHGRPITTWTLLVDLEGLNMRHLWRPGIKTLLTIIELVENNYPETMSQVLIIRAPRVFPILWTLVSTFIDEHTRSKFLFYGGNDYQEAGGLVDYMSDDYIPEFLGGKCQSLVGEGGLVPKNLYLPGEEIEAGGRQHLQLSDQSIYRSVSLARSQVHEVLLLIQEPSAVICWDFDIMKSDVTFTVFRIKNHVPNRAVSNADPTSPDTVPTKASSTISESEKTSVIEKTWREGHEYFIEEPHLVCHDGESIQGSHVTRHKSTYMLQWKYQEATGHGSPLDILDNITAPKAQIMYYFETLKSADYRGSMSSLQSCQSGFSSLSSNTNKSVSSSCPSR
ncbi:CRAL-TRIO lipid binding domain [Trinorchestia longiramus]|nr:CRAL-TRIO lipid binding domain [Trinorchestia longiramus]